ncbi:hypothetical protein [Halodurantibacterium flavum]|uniref:Uncharacterized protein n=1 Tax=Halodurantibacterium flavum TaxID=1382802 RepID=A0ABW4S952_9RHOB
MSSSFWVALLPHLMELIGALATMVLVWLTAEIRRRWGIEIEARHREALHSALMTGIRAALFRGLTGPDVVQAAIEYAGESVPDALRRLRPAPHVLNDLTSAKLRELLDGPRWVELDAGDTGEPAR